MSQKTKIEWTDSTWNPVRGCTKISPGCARCYAERFSERFRGVPGHPFEDGFDLRLVPEKLEDPLRWLTPRRVFVNSMSDLFHEAVPTEYIACVADVMLRSPQHEFQVLTKRADRMAELLDTSLRGAASASHILWGVSVENRKHGIPRLEALRLSGARRRFLSCEPLLEALGPLNLDGIDWVIVGGESGHRARPMRPDWARVIRDQCAASKIPFFFKQWGGPRKNAAGRILDGRTHDEMPIRPSW